MAEAIANATTVRHGASSARWRSSDRPDSSADALPMVSLVIPVRNEEATIGTCLAHVMGQDYPVDRFEVLIADGMSSDNTRQIIHAVRGGQIAVRVLDNLAKGRAQGLNAAIRTARGDVIMRVDARSVIASDYVSRCVDLLRRTGADNVGGSISPLAESSTQEAIGIAQAARFGVGNSQYRLGRKSGYFDQVYLGCFRREVFDQIGYFDEDASVISEDSDINERIRAAGGKVYLDSGLVTEYYPRETFKKLWQLYFRYGAARAGNLVKHHQLTSWRQTAAPAFLAALFSLVSLSLWKEAFLPPLVGLIAGYLAVDIAVSLYLAARREKLGLLFRLLLTFPCMHFAWAIGFWSRLSTPQIGGRYWST